MITLTPRFSRNIWNNWDNTDKRVINNSEV